MLAGGVFHGHEGCASCFKRGDKARQNLGPIGTPDHIRVAGVGDNSPFCSRLHVKEFIQPRIDDA